MDIKKVYEDLLLWTEFKMKEIKGRKAIIGISGGKDSSVAAALMVKVLGKENVIGILMPQGEQYDIDYAKEICSILGIKSYEVNIKGVVDEILNDVKENLGSVKEKTSTNIPPRIRMTYLYAFSQSIEGSRVINTSNLSEDYVGYATIYGDTAGAISPFGGLTTEEVIEIGRMLNVPEKFLIKSPEDGLTGKTDESVLNVSYKSINDMIRKGKTSKEDMEIIKKLHFQSRFKMELIPKFIPKNLSYFVPKEED